MLPSIVGLFIHDSKSPFHSRSSRGITDLCPKPQDPWLKYTRILFTTLTKSSWVDQGQPSHHPTFIQTFFLPLLVLAATNPGVSPKSLGISTSAPNTIRALIISMWSCYWEERNLLMETHCPNPLHPLFSSLCWNAHPVCHLFVFLGH